MFDIFSPMIEFFRGVGSNIEINDIFIVAVAVFLLTVIIVILSTSHAYEARLIKAIDMLNTYFIDNPQITDENLVAFNAKMKHKKVPKQLRKQWQQYVLYREGKASEYMSFDNCVTIPIKNSSYKRDMKIMNIITYIVAGLTLFLNCFCVPSGYSTADVLREVLLCPVLLLALNWLITIFLDLRHNAIVSDLYQNYQYFEVNIDKATQTLPEYVDYEVLFDRNEIKKGIPILYAYLQKRAEEEKRELERARLKNVEHEKFNFDEAGVAGSLVLERAMQEAENYIAERKKYNQDTEQVNSDITQEDMNYREITKEYNRQMQVSRETFANFKAQLEDVSSSIEANYLKKQQQQELDRQRNLERDFDTATERHKKVIEGFHAELDTLDQFKENSKKTLQDAMMSEFKTYSSKVYDEAKKVVEEREKEKYAKLKQQIRDLEEKIIAKDKELEGVYTQNYNLSEQLGQAAAAQQYVQPVAEQPVVQEQPIQENYTMSETTDLGVEIPVVEDEPIFEPEISTAQEDDSIKVENISVEENVPVKPVSRRGRPKKVVETKKPVAIKKGRGRPKKVVTEAPVEETVAEVKKGRGRPKKVVPTTEVAKQQGEKKGRGRPKKVVNETPVTETPVAEVKKGRGRPKKVAEATEVKETKRRGRPRKEETETVQPAEPKKGRGRPKKVQTEEVVAQEPKRRGRPKKEDMPSDITDIDAYLKEIDDAIAKENAKLEDAQKELAKKARISKRKK